MKKLLYSLIAIFITFGVRAQTFTPIHNYQAPDGLELIKHLGIPYGTDTSDYLLPDSVKIAGIARKSASIFFQTTDSSFYVHWGKWIKVNVGGGSVQWWPKTTDIDVLQNTIDSSSFGIKKLDGTVKNVVVYADGLTGVSGGGITQVNSDWNATSGVSAILNKPTLFSGSYTDLTSKPTLFSGSYTDLTNKPTLFSGSYLDLSNKPTIPAQFNPIAGTNMTITGTYPNITFNSTASGGGTVTQFNFTNSTGIIGTVTNATTIPTLSLVIDTSAISSFSTKVRSLFNATSPIVYNNGNISLDTTVVHTSAYNNATYQGKLTLTTTGTSGAATLTGNTLNIPQYSGGTYTLPTASATVLGGIKVGGGLAIDGSGVLSATGGSTPSLEQVVQVGNTSSIDIKIHGLTIGTGLSSNPTNTAIGSNALSNNTSSQGRNTAIGNSTLSNNTSGKSNTAVGNTALSFNTIGSLNTAIGDNALNANTSGFYNTAGGYSALSKNTSGTGNTAFGYGGLSTNLDGQNNAAFGFSALTNNYEGSENTAVGGSAPLESNTNGSRNTGIGSDALRLNIIGTENTSVGYGSLNTSSTGNNNVAIGVNALYYNELDSNTAVGSKSDAKFKEDVASAKSFDASNIVGTKIYIPSHGFGADGSIRLLKFTQGSSTIDGLTNNQIYVATIISLDTISISEVIPGGSSTGNTLTPQFQFTNTTSLGNGSEPTQSNQVVLGNSNITQVLTYGNVLSKVAVKSSDPTTTDIPAGFTAVFRNSTSGLTYLWANISGTLIKVQLQ